MSKYIDADRLRAEIERRKKFHDDAMIACTGLTNIALTHGAGWKEDNELLAFIDSLQQEQPKVDLKEEIASLFSKNPIPHEHITNWPLLKNTALHFFNLGLNARKED